MLQFGSAPVMERKVHQQLKFTRQNGSVVRTEHEFFGHLCDALHGIAEVMVVGGHVGLADFRHYVGKHRPQTEEHIVAYEVMDPPT